VIPGGIESVIRNLNSFSNLDLRIINDKANEAICMFGESYLVKDEKFSYIVVLGGDDDGKLFHLRSVETKIGRASSSIEYEENSGLIGLSQTYLSVTRVDGCSHAVFKKKGTECYFVDLGSTNGSYINHRAVLKGESVLLSDGDTIDLGKGSTRARLIFYKTGKMPVV
jgi:pSer/pThr/pTyr-binding forkhead associated (FHA) protein